MQLNHVNGAHGMKDLVISHVEEGSEETLETNWFKNKMEEIVLINLTGSKTAILSNALPVNGNKDIALLHGEKTKTLELRN